jgi:hypothetical protein
MPHIKILRRCVPPQITQKANRVKPYFSDAMTRRVGATGGPDVAPSQVSCWLRPDVCFPAVDSGASRCQSSSRAAIVERGVILCGIRWYVAYLNSYRQPEEMVEDRVPLQSLALIADHRRDDRVASSQAATPNSSATRAACALMSLPSIFRTCLFLIIAMASRAASVRRAVKKLPKPSPGPVRRLIPRWGIVALTLSR